MADAEDSKSSALTGMRVRLPPPAPAFALRATVGKQDFFSVTSSDKQSTFRFEVDVGEVDQEELGRRITNRYTYKALAYLVIFIITKYGLRYFSFNALMRSDSELPSLYYVSGIYLAYIFVSVILYKRMVSSSKIYTDQLKVRKRRSMVLKFFMFLCFAAMGYNFLTLTGFIVWGVVALIITMIDLL